MARDVGLGVRLTKDELRRTRRMARRIDTNGAALGRVATLDVLIRLEAMVEALGEKAVAECVRVRGIVGALEWWRENERPAEAPPRPAVQETDGEVSEAFAASGQSNELREPEGAQP